MLLQMGELLFQGDQAALQFGDVGAVTGGGFLEVFGGAAKFLPGLTSDFFLKETGDIGHGGVSGLIEVGIIQEYPDFTNCLKIAVDDNGGSCVDFSVVTDGQ